MMIDDNFDLVDEQIEIIEPYWTPRRFVYMLIILITLIAFIVYVLSPLFIPPAPPVLSPLPRQQV
jgi:hypothetical protein